MFALKSLIFQHNTVFIERFSKKFLVILSAFLALYGLKYWYQPGEVAQSGMCRLRKPVAQGLTLECV